MAEKQAFTGNPYDPDNFTKGGGLWDGKVVTIISAKAVIDPMRYKDGSPVLDKETQEPIIKHVLELIGIADDEERERRETYSAGYLVPTADGEGFVTPEGLTSQFSPKSEIARFFAGLVVGGFPKDGVWDAKANRSQISRLVGARIKFKAEARLDAKGNVKKNAKGYDDNKFYPVEFVGYKAGGSGNGSTPTAPSSELRDKAVGAVIGVLSEAGGTLTRAELYRKITASFAKDTDCNKILALLVREDFHNDVPWKRSGTQFVLGA